MTMQGPEYAVFTEFSPDNKTMTPGFNTRVFTDVDSQRGNSIRCDFKTRAITLAPRNGVRVVLDDRVASPGDEAGAPASAGAGVAG